MEHAQTSGLPFAFTGNKYLDYVILSSIIITGALIASSIIHFFLNRYFERSSRLLKVDPTNYRFFKNAVRLTIFSLALFSIFYIIPEFHALGITLFASAGIFAAVAGFASQAAFSNIVSGIFIVMFRPFRVGDFVQFSSQPPGRVEDITLRHTVIKTFENRRIIVPNTIISAEVIVNSSIRDELICQFVEVHVALTADVERAFAIMQEEAMAHSDFLDHRQPYEKDMGINPVETRIVEFTEYAVKLRAYVWTIGPIEAFNLKTDLYRILLDRFRRENIEIPYPYRSVVMRENIWEKKDYGKKEQE